MIKEEQALTVLYGIRSENMDLDNLYQKERYDAVSLAIKVLKAHIKQKSKEKHLPLFYKFGKWISVVNNLPVDNQEVIFSNTSGVVYAGKYFDDKNGVSWYSYKDAFFVKDSEVMFWMPLPAAEK